MSDFTALKTAIQNAIKQNGNNEITGNILQSVLLSVVNTMGDGAINDLVTALTNEVTNRTNAVGTEATARQDADTALGGRINTEATARENADTALGGRIDGVTAIVNTISSILSAGYVYKGIATPSTNPNIPLGRVFYIATASGTYTNFGNLTVSAGINILKYNGSAWSVDVVILIDDTPTKGSNNLVKSGGVFANIGAFDISDYNKTGTTLATYANLTAALAALPAEYQKGGMSVRYVQSSDNKYVQYFLTKNTWSASEADWEKVNLEEEVSQLKKNASVINVSAEYPTGGTGGTNIYTPTNARDVVPAARRKPGTTLIYLTEDGLRIERYDLDAYDSTNWVYGVWTQLATLPFLNITEISGESSFSNRVSTFDYIPIKYKRPGLIISYIKNGKWIVEQFIGTSWTSADASWIQIAHFSDIANISLYDDSIQENLFYQYLQSKYFEIGSIYQDSEIVNNKHCRSIYFPCKRGDSIVCKNRNFEFVLFTYDSTKTYIISSAWNDYKCDITTDGYFRLVFRNTAGTDFDLDDITPKDIVLVRQIDDNYQYESLKLHTRQRVLWSQKGDFVLGYLSNGVLNAHNKRMSTLRYYPVKKGDKVFVNNNLYSFYVTEYNQSKQFISASTYYKREYVSPGDRPVGWYVVKNDGFVRLTFSIISGDDDWDSTIVDTADRFCGIIPQEISFEERMAWDGINHSKIIVEKKPLFVPTQETIYQDGTFINGNLWLFPENDGTINIINPETGVVVDTKTHTLGHCSSVDYNKNNDCLICKQEGSGHATSQKIQIYKNPSAANSLAPTDANCTLVNLFNDEFHFNDEGTGSIMWGEANDIVYFCNGREASETGNENQWSNKHYIYKIRLGMGSNDLSSETDGMGVFVSGKADDEYNGTCCIIKTYTGYIMEGCDTYVGSSGNTYFQGAEYDGYIYIGWGTSGHNFLKIQLDDDYDTFKVVENYMHHFYGSDQSTEIMYEPELVALHNGRIFCGSRKYGVSSVLLNFEL